MKEQRWIVIPNWDVFQHYRNRDPRWIKDYVDQLDKDEHLALTFAERGLLADVRRLYARRGRALSGDTASLGRALNQRVLEKQLQRLVDAGLIEFSASKPLAQPRQPASPEVEKREKPLPLKRKPVDNNSTGPPPPRFPCPKCGILLRGPQAIADHIANVHW